jgi:hypothetical protein
MSVIWKYAVKAQTTFEIVAPAARPLTVQMQGNDAVLWMLVTGRHRPSAEHRTHRFRVVRTGEDFQPDGWAYVGTFQPEPGLVFHLFAELPS